MDFLDVRTLPTEAMYGEGALKTNLAAIPHRMRTAFDVMAKAEAGLIKANDSFGCALARPFNSDEASSFKPWAWDDPQDFVLFVAGWGPERNRYIANAVRKLRPALREQVDTLLMRCAPESYGDVEPVESAELVDGEWRFPWGDFPWGGATYVHVGGLCLPVAVSCLLEVEDDAIAKLIGGSVGAEMLKIDHPEEFGPNS